MSDRPAAAEPLVQATGAEAPLLPAAGERPLPTVAPGHWILDPDRSRATFAVRNLGLKVVRGSVPVRQGLAEVSADGRLVSLRAVLALDEVATGNARRDVHLAKPHLLDTGCHPRMLFEGSGSQSLVSGVLSVRGRQLPVELTTGVEQEAADEVTVTGHAAFDRRPLGMKVPRILVGCWIEVTIRAVFARDLG